MLLGVDVGGTFTDFYLIADDGAVTVYKRPSTPGDPARAILDGLDEMGVRPDEIVHGSTVATNAIIERKGAKTALITTKGFRDVLLIGRQTRPRLYDLSPTREPPLVPDELRLEVDERLDHRGEVLRPLDTKNIERLLDEVQAAGVESLAVCFLFSFLNPEHEAAVAAAARKRKLFVSVSHEVLAEHREYERTSTTVANAYVSPVMTRYLRRLASDVRKRGVQRLRIMASNGGSMPAEVAGRLAVRTAVSGPAGGVAGAFALAQQAGYDRIITLDMGGTSTDVSLCPGRILERDETHVGAFPVRGPTVDVLSVGAGGGSIARIDEGGALQVGPESVGADPGPACYGVGDQPAVTDAHVVLGRIAAGGLLGGRMELHEERSFAALAPIAEHYDGDPHRAAAAVLQVANAHMERAMRVVSVERGHDPRDFALLAFGGAGPLHACDVARALRMERVIIPRFPGVLSALGMGTAPVTKDVASAVMKTMDEGFLPDALFAELESRGRHELKTEGFDAARADTIRLVDLRYLGQSYELSVRADEGMSTTISERFHATHRERYGHADESRPVEVVTARVRLVTAPARARSENAPPRRPRPREAKRAFSRPVSFESGRGIKALATGVFKRESLRPGAHFAGPAIVAQMDSTTVVPPGWRAEVDRYENVVLARLPGAR